MLIITDKEVLAQVSVPVSDYRSVEIALLEMRMHQHKCAGLAAIQLGHPVRIIMLNTDNVKATILNPEIQVIGKATRTSREGCLSVPGKIVKKVRHYQVTLTGLNEDWTPYKRKLKGFDAFVAQHEVDHLDGVTI